jgi:hypothetical protein
MAAQAAINAAAAAAAIAIANVFHNNGAANPSTIFHVLQTIRPYDGSTSAGHWITSFNEECAVYNLDSAWRVNNLDRVLLKSPKSWWATRKTFFQNAIRDDARNHAADPVARNLAYAATWLLATTEMRTFFNDRNIRETARAKNASILFRVGEDPMTYVTNKIACCTIINADMSEEDKIRHLLKGLPDGTREFVAVAQIDTVAQFLQRLSSHLENKPKAKIVENSNNNNYNSNRNSNQNQNSRSDFNPRDQNSSRNGRNHNNDNNGRNQQTVSTPSQSPQLSGDQLRGITERRERPTCDYCHRPGHLRANCWQLAREEGRPINDRRYNGNRNNENPPAFNNGNPPSFSKPQGN